MQTFRNGVAALILSLLVVVAPSAVSAGKLPPELATVNPGAVEPGATFELSISGFFCGVDLDVTATPSGGTAVSLGSIPADAITDGAFSGPFVAPSTPGSYLVEVRYSFECQGSAAAPLTVNTPTTTTTTTTTTTLPASTTTTSVAQAVAPTTAAPTTALPATGRTTGGLVWVALAALLGGVGLVTVAARRS